MSGASERGPGSADASRALGTILAVAAHELSSPMTGILAFARYAADHTDPKDRIHELLIDIEREAQRCTATIQDLLLFSRVGGLEEPQSARLCDVVERALAALSGPIAQHCIAIARELAPDAPELRVQTWSLHQALVSLLASAIDALIASRTESPRIALHGAPDADGVLLTLTDNGPGHLRTEGVPAQAVRAWQALARAVIATQGGAVTVHDVPQGFSVRVWLPATRG